MVADHFNLFSKDPPELTVEQIDAGGKALRERQMKGRITVRWENLPKSAKKKWLEHAAAVLRAGGF